MHTILWSCWNKIFLTLTFDFDESNYFELATLCITGLVGFASARDRECLERLVIKLRKGGYFHQDLPPLSALVAKADSRLFSTIETRADHVLSHLQPPRKKIKYSLRPRTHEIC